MQQQHCSVLPAPVDVDSNNESMCGDVLCRCCSPLSGDCACAAGTDLIGKVVEDAPDCYGLTFPLLVRSYFAYPHHIQTDHFSEPWKVEQSQI